MDGVINLYKPPGMSSAAAVHFVRRCTGQKKSGHAGTLDPAAEGVLILCLGRATKLAERFMDLPKVYRTTIRLDVTSDGFDREGEQRPVAVAQPPSGERVAAALAAFEGTIAQVPPAASAVWVGGRRSYKLARAGQAVELPPRPVTIYWVHLWSYDWPRVDVEIACGRGTYIRSMARDLGAALGTGGVLERLRRDAVGPFTAAAAIEPRTLERMDEPASVVVAIDEVLKRVAPPLDGPLEGPLDGPRGGDARIPPRPTG